MCSRESSRLHPLTTASHVRQRRSNLGDEAVTVETVESVILEAIMERGLVRFRDVAVSAAIGTSIVLILFSLTETRAGAFAIFLLLPGAALAWLVGSGAHDLAGLLLYGVGNVVFYAGVPLIIFVLLKFRRRGRAD